MHHYWRAPGGKRPGWASEVLDGLYGDPLDLLAADEPTMPAGVPVEVVYEEGGYLLVERLRADGVPPLR